MNSNSDGTKLHETEEEVPEKKISGHGLIIGKVLAFGYCLSASFTDVVFKVRYF